MGGVGVRSKGSCSRSSCRRMATRRQLQGAHPNLNWLSPSCRRCHGSLLLCAVRAWQSTPVEGKKEYLDGGARLLAARRICRLGEKEADEEEEKSEDDNDSEQNSDIPHGPDTSSFRAFMISFLSPSSSFNASMEIIPEQNEETGYPTLTPVGKANKGKTGLLSRGKHSIGKIINKAARISGFKQNPEPKISKEVVNHAEPVAPVLELEEPKEISSLSNLPVMSEPSVLLSEMMRSILYSSLPILSQGGSWVLLYSTWRHGISLSTLYRRSKLCPGYSLLVVGDKKKRGSFWWFG